MFKECFNKNGQNLEMSAKMASPGLLKITVFWNKDYDVITSVHIVTKKILSRDSSYIVDEIIWPKIGNSSISMREVIITWILEEFDQKNRFFKGWSWFKFNNLGLSRGTNVKFYTSPAKRVKAKSQKVLEANSYVCRSYRRKTGRRRG